MEDAIRNFNKQFLYKPRIENAQRLIKKKKFAVGGMGGSHLSADLIAILRPELDIFIHRDYGIPACLTDGNERLFVASSYSGNTEESIDFAEKALSKGYAIATISVGGKLLEFAKKNSLPHIIIPNTGIQPRSALGFSILALSAMIGDAKLSEELGALVPALEPDTLENKGKALSEKLRSSVPIIYSSARNAGIAYNWKIKMNETGKIPAFCNVIPELNHNEMTGFDTIGSTEGLSRRFYVIFLTDESDNPKNQKRMQITKKLYEERGIKTVEVPLKGLTTAEKIFNSLLVADWTALHLSRIYGTEAEQVPMVEQFKRLISNI